MANVRPCIALLAPIAPSRIGSGLALRTRMWESILRRLGHVVTFVVPIADEPAAAIDPEAVTIEPFYLWHRWQPERSRRAPEYLGALVGPDHGPFELVVAVRSYMGPFGVGFAGAQGAPLIVDLDDDDEAYLRDAGVDDESARYRELVEWLDERAAILFSVAGFGATEPLPNVVPPDAVGPGPPDPGHLRDTVPSPPTVLCVANFTYAPNRAGAAWLVDEVMPRLRRTHPDVTLRLVGPASTDFDGGVGVVDDLADVYRHATVAAVPVHRGSGSRIKLLEAWGRGVPVVSTSLGAEGLIEPITGDPSDGALIADHPAGFAAELARVIDDRSLSRVLVDAGRRHAERFSAQAVAGEVAPLLRNIMAGRSVRRVPAPSPGLLVSEVADGLVVDDPATGRIHRLDPLSSIVFTLAADRPRLAALSDDVAALYGETTAPDEVVELAVTELTRLGVLGR